MVESVFATLTKELLIDTEFATRNEASRDLFEFIEIWYNRQRDIPRLATAHRCSCMKNKS